MGPCIEDGLARKEIWMNKRRVGVLQCSDLL
jgi:hypothetical protein